MYVRYVRGNPAYGKNDFHDNGDGTITDRATGLMWQKADSGKGMNWEPALAYAAQSQTCRAFRLAPAQRQGTAEHRGLHPRARRNAVTRDLAPLPSHKTRRWRLSVLLDQHDTP